MKRTPVGEEVLAKGEMKYDDEKEYDKDGKEADGGGFRKSGGKLCKMQKSDDLTGDDLQKSLDKLEDFAAETDTTSRKDALLAKAQEGDLSDEEREELFKALGGDIQTDDEPTLVETIEKSMEDNETLQKSLDVSDFLSEQHGELVKSLGMLAEHQEQSDHRQHQFNLLLAKAVTDVGNLVKSVAESLDVIGGQPAAQPKSKGVNAPVAQPMAKSFAGAGGEGEALTKSQVMAGLEGLYQEMLDKGGNTRLDNGVDLLTEISKFESSGMLHPSVEGMVKTRINQQRQAH